MSFSSACGVADVVDIGRLGYGGDGLAETDEGPVYVPFTLPGETVEIKRNDGRGSLHRVVAASRDRVAPICRHFSKCGGCALQHMERGAYLAWKRQTVVDRLAQRGIAADVEAVVPISARSRRRAVFAAVKTAKGVVFGFHQKGSRHIVAIGECPVLVPAIVDKLGVVADMAGETLEAGRPARIAVLAADNGLDIAIQNAGRIGRRQREILGAHAADAALARLTVDGSEIFLNRRPEIRAGAAPLLPVPGGFVQASSAAEATIAAAIAEHVGNAAPVVDLFAGIGTFALRLAQSAAVTAIDGIPELVEAIAAAANTTSGLKPVTALKRDLFNNPLAAIELDRFAAVVFDPPAAGAKAQAETIAASKVAKVAAVSCNPATLARDARILIDGGYRLIRVVPVDQFLFSAEIEVIATFER